MARSKTFFGIRRGQAMGMVFSRGETGKGEAQQITRALPESVKNPQTEAQMVQRFIMASAVKAYSFLKELSDHGFEGFSYGQQSMNEFLRQNIAAAKAASNVALGFPFYGVSYPFVFEGAVLADGSLRPFDINYLSSTGQNTSRELYLTIGDGSWRTEEEFAAVLGLSTTDDIFTIAAVATAFDSGYIADTGGSYYAEKQLVYLRIKLKRTPTDTEVTSVEDTWSNLFEVEENGLSITLEDNALGEAGFNIECYSYADDTAIESYTTVKSNYRSGKWLRSRAVMHFSDTWRNLATKAQAFASYPVGTERILNGAGMTRSSSADVVVLGLWQISELGSSSRGEFCLAISINGTPYLLVDQNEEDEGAGIVISMAVTLDDYNNNMITFSPSPLSGSSRFTTISIQGGLAESSRISISTLYSYLANNQISNLPWGTASGAVHVSALPTLHTTSEG